MHTDRQSKCSAHEVAIRRGSLVAVTQIASFMKAMASPLQLSSNSSSRVNHASGCLPAVCHSTIVPVSAASDVNPGPVRRGSVAATSIDARLKGGSSRAVVVVEAPGATERPTS